MYRFEWIERLKLRSSAPPPGGRLADISPVVLALGLTSFLTDISSEMVSSVLPAYLVLHLRLSPLQYGAIDGIYNGLGIALAGIAAGWLADRTRRRKEVAGMGYGLSAVCKLLLLAAAGAWGWILLITGLDRLGKGIRTAPRDALISLSSPGPWLASAFGVHRAMDAAGALLGPLTAFAVLAYLPRGFSVLWIISFVIALLGLAALWLFVPASGTRAGETRSEQQSPAAAISSPGFLALLVCSALLAASTVSDGFLYLFLQQRCGTAAGAVALFYVATAAVYMTFAIPVARLADRTGRAVVLIGGYAMLIAVYCILLFASAGGIGMLAVCLFLFGLYYAGTEGVLIALASAIAPTGRRATGLAVIATGIGVGKLMSSVLFGWLWQNYGMRAATGSFAVALLASAMISMMVLRRQGLIR